MNHHAITGTQNNHGEPTGRAQITSGYCLPSTYVLHTVGPIYDGESETMEGSYMANQLASCYESCLELASRHGALSIAFCCISTGVFGYPNDSAAKTAMTTVINWLSNPNNHNKIDQVVFNVFTDTDLDLYQNMFNSL
mmetsp:Transcript_8978/g.11771  ORF Transcript_8978/g.11771 Transcript_8978/m.11771 type:complete len:138 (+) Transcript_8978:551-964(+)